MYKKMMTTLMAMVLCIALLAGCGGTATQTQTQATTPVVTVPTEADYARMITEIPANADIDTIIKLENRNFKHIQAMKPIFDADSYSAYSKAVTKLKKDKTMEAAEAATAARKSLVQTDTVADRIWFIWDGTTMPLLDGENLSEDAIDESQMFGYGFEPLLIKYMVEDQSKCKGNIIAVSGGGMLVWSNGAEGYPAAGVFNDLGYNYFLLQRRVGPYSNEDIFMDYQRAVRVVKYHAAKENYGGQDMYAALGWSGGGSTILGGSVNELYGDLNPTKYDKEYVPDEIDAISSDLDVELVLYGAASGLAGTENKHLPAFYICVGSEDGEGPVHSTNLYNDAIALGLPAMLNIIEGAPHGFGVGLPPANGMTPGTELWPAQADKFMQANLGFQTNR